MFNTERYSRHICLARQVPDQWLTWWLQEKHQHICLGQLPTFLPDVWTDQTNMLLHRTWNFPHMHLNKWSPASCLPLAACVIILRIILIKMHLRSPSHLHVCHFYVSHLWLFYQSCKRISGSLIKSWRWKTDLLVLPPLLLLPTPHINSLVLVQAKESVKCSARVRFLFWNTIWLLLLLLESKARKINVCESSASTAPTGGESSCFGPRPDQTRHACVWESLSSKLSYIFHFCRIIETCQLSLCDHLQPVCTVIWLLVCLLPPCPLASRSFPSSFLPSPFAARSPKPAELSDFQLCCQ